MKARNLPESTDPSTTQIIEMPCEHNLSSEIYTLIALDATWASFNGNSNKILLYKPNWLKLDKPTSIKVQISVEKS